MLDFGDGGWLVNGWARDNWGCGAIPGQYLRKLVTQQPGPARIPRNLLDACEFGFDQFPSFALRLRQRQLAGVEFLQQRFLGEIILVHDTRLALQHAPGLAAFDGEQHHLPRHRVIFNFATELGLDDAVLFLGAISEKELLTLYEGAAVYVYPAPEEDFGMGVIESMSKGVPVVAWNQAGPTVTVGPGTGHLAEPLDVDDYAAGIAKLLDDRSENQATGQRAFEWARRFDWERHIDILERAVLDVARIHEQVALEAATA